MSAMDEAWRSELALLRDAASQNTTDGSRQFAQEFVLHRRNRRAALDESLIEYVQRPEVKMLDDVAARLRLFRRGESLALMPNLFVREP